MIHAAKRTPKRPIILICRIIFRFGLAFFMLAPLCHAQNISAGQDSRFNYVLHDTLEQSDIQHLVRALQENYQRIQHHLQVPSLPTITVQIWSDEEAYQDAMAATLGMRFPGSRGYVTGPQELRLLYHRRLSAQEEAVHEFAHVVSLNLNPEFGNNPRWLWEAVALYESGAFRDPLRVDYLRAGELPTIEELNAGFSTGKNIYDVGYLLIEYFFSNWDSDRYIDLIKANGDIKTVLGISQSKFEDGWHSYLKTKYLNP